MIRFHALTHAGKVRNVTPKVEKQEKKRKICGRAKKRMLYIRRFVNVVPTMGRKLGPNNNAARKEATGSLT